MGGISLGPPSMNSFFAFREMKSDLLTFQKLASNFVTFFGKLLDLLDDFTEDFPRYGHIVHLCNDGSSNRLKVSLRNVYVDLFQLFQSIAQVFTIGNGREEAQFHSPELANSVTELRYQTDSGHY